MKSTDITSKPIFKYSQRIVGFFLTNLCFLCFNFFLIVAFFFIPPTMDNILIYSGSALALGPSLIGLFKVMYNYREYGELSLKDYLSSVRRNVTQGLLYSGLHVSLSLVLIVDIVYFINRSWWGLALLFGLIQLFSFLSFLVGNYYLANFELSFKSLLRLPVYSLIVHPQFLLQFIGVIGIALALLLVLPKLAMLFVFAFFGYLFTKPAKLLSGKVQIDLEVANNE